MRVWKQRDAGLDPEAVRTLAGQCGLPEWMARLLASRGADTGAKIQAFLTPAFEQLHAPRTLPGVTECLRTLQELREEKPGARVAVYGDYDVDGVCASVIMQEALQAWGFHAQVYIPDRHEEGYGLNVEAVRRLREDPQWKCDAVVTVDCGITSLREVALGRSLGMRMIVTDHHTIGEKLPEADAVVSPLLEGAPFGGLCGAGVAFKLAWAMCGEAFARERLDVCALATVADMVSLLGENRALVALGLQKMIHSPRTGIWALLDAAGLLDKKETLNAENISFQLAPRLNAAGRLESALQSYRLLAAQDADEAVRIARELNRLNERRKEKQETVIRQAQVQAEQMDLKRLRAMVVCGEDWDSGVVGLAAGKLAEQFDCPAVCLTRSGTDWVGSGRSACGVDLYGALSACRDLFLRFGGHRAAAGLTLRGEALEEFRQRFSDAVEEQLGDGDLRGEREYDSELPLEALNEETVTLLSRLEPFGMDNPAPRVVVRDVRMEGLRAVGRDGKHLQCTFQGDGVQRKGIYFGGSAWLDKPLGTVDVLGVPIRNTFRGTTTVQVQVTELQMRPAQLFEEPERETETLWQDLTDAAANKDPVGVERVSLTEAEGWLEKKRGTLVLCRCPGTARDWFARHPGLDFAVGSAMDPRAFSAVALYCPHRSIHPGYSRILLADGAFPGEEEALGRRIPGLRTAQDRGKTEALLEDMTVTRDQLLKLYGLIKLMDRMGELKRLEREEAARRTGLTLARLRTALRLLEDALLIRGQWEPFGAELLPFRHADPGLTPLGGWLYRP